MFPRIWFISLRRLFVSKNDSKASARTTKPGGTGIPACVISQREAHFHPAFGASFFQILLNGRIIRFYYSFLWKLCSDLFRYDFLENIYTFSMQKDCIYLDYASTHPRKKEIIALREQFELTSYANIGRGNYDLAEASMIAYQNSKKAVSRWIGCEAVEVIYTYSATYALNMLALAVEQNGVVGKGDTILVSVSEHHANIVPWQMIAERVGAQVQFVHLDSDYCLDLDDLQNKLNSSVKVVSLQYGSNVT